MSTAKRISDLRHFYDLLEELENHVGGMRCLFDCHGRLNWPQRGVYFFFEESEKRTTTGTGLRVVRVGTHALRVGSATKLWGRLSQHRGVVKSGGGNHRGSVFRHLVGNALMGRNPRLAAAMWEGKARPPKEERFTELALERVVSKVIGAMPFLWLAVDDPPGPDSLRGYVERNSIALLSCYGKTPVDTSSDNWLGWHCSRKRVRESGLWNNNHVDESYDLSFLDTMDALVRQVGNGG